MTIDDHNRIIDALGGTAATARLCGIRMASVSGWRQAGIPSARLMYLRLLRPDLFEVRENAAQCPKPDNT